MTDLMKRSLTISLIDSFLYSLMVGAGESYLPAYVLSLGLSEWMAGMIATMPLLSGAFLQIVGTEALRALKNHKVWVWTLAFLQASTFIPLIFFAMGSKPHFLTLFIVLSFYWGAGFSISPAWNYWMGHLVSQDLAQKFFSRRSRISQGGLLLGLIIGGVALHNNVHLGPFTSTFGLIFFVAFLSRILSSWLLSQKYYAPNWSGETTYLHVQESWKIFWKDKRKRNFFLSILPFQMSVFFSAPFVTPYMLAKLKMNYGQYMSAVAFLMIGKMLSTFYIDRIKDYDYRAAFRWGLFIIAPAPFFWLFSDHFPYILALQLFSGTAYGFFELGLALMFFKDLNPDEKIPFLTFYNMLNCLGLLVGSALGGIWLRTQNSELKAYYYLFFIGGCLRLVGSWLLISQSKKLQYQSKMKE
jgi:MFS family permease